MKVLLIFYQMLPGCFYPAAEDTLRFYLICEDLDRFSVINRMSSICEAVSRVFLRFIGFGVIYPQLGEKLGFFFRIQVAFTPKLGEWG